VQYTPLHPASLYHRSQATPQLALHCDRYLPCLRLGWTSLRHSIGLCRQHQPTNVEHNLIADAVVHRRGSTAALAACKHWLKRVSHLRNGHTPAGKHDRMTQRCIAVTYPPPCVRKCGVVRLLRQINFFEIAKYSVIFIPSKTSAEDCSGERMHLPGWMQDQQPCVLRATQWSVTICNRVHSS